MNTTTQTDAPVPPSGAGFYDGLEAWLGAFTAYVQQTYGILLSVTRTRTALPFTDLNTGLDYFDEFYLVAPALGGYVFPVGAQTLVLLNYSMPGYASIVLTTAANWMGVPAPQPLQAAPVAPPPSPAPAANPIGPVFPNGVQYADLSKGAYIAGQTYMEPSTGIVYRLQGYPTPFGVAKYWVRA